MSDDYAAQIAQIKKAASLEGIQAIARAYRARAVGEGGILYSRPVGSVTSEGIALELASKTGEPIINHTPRAQFLGDKQAMLQAEKDGTSDAGKIGGVGLSGDTLWVAGTTPGFTAAVNTAQPAPATRDTAQEALAFNQQRDQRLGQEAAQRNPGAPGQMV